MAAEQIGMLHIVDYIVLVAVVFLAVSVGLIKSFVSGRHGTTKDYLVGNLKVRIFFVRICNFRMNY